MFIQLFGLLVIIRYTGTGNTIGYMGYGPPYNIGKDQTETLLEKKYLDQAVFWSLKIVYSLKFNIWKYLPDKKAFKTSSVKETSGKRSLIKCTLMKMFSDEHAQLFMSIFYVCYEYCRSELKIFKHRTPVIHQSNQTGEANSNFNCQL